MKLDRPLAGARIGACCAFPDGDGKVYGIGYCVHKSRWRQGFGTEMVDLTLDWVRERGGTAVTAEAARENRGSCALLRSAGLPFCGRPPSGNTIWGSRLRA